MIFWMKYSEAEAEIMSVPIFLTSPAKETQDTGGDNVVVELGLLW